MIFKYKPKIILGPGDTLREELEYYGWTQTDLAEILNMSKKHISNILNNKVPITFNLAKLLSEVFKQSPEFWINLDTNYRLQMQEDASESLTSARAIIFRYMPVNLMRKLKWLTSEANDTSGLIEEVKKFWAIDSLDFGFLDNEVAACFRKSKAYKNFNRYHAMTWLRKAIIEAQITNAKKYDKAKLLELSAKISNYSIMEDGIRKFIKELSECGVIFLLLPHLEKTYIDGASFMSEKNPVLVYTARLNRDDNFWWTITHEIGHILMHLDAKNNYFIDSMDSDCFVTEQEQEANDFANCKLKSEEIIKEANMMTSKTKKTITHLSEKLGISAAYIVGCLQFHGIVPYTRLNNIKQKVF